MPDGVRIPLRLVLVDDHEMVLHGLTAMLAHFTADVVIVGTATSLASARRAIAADPPDIVLSDVRLGRDSGLDLVRELGRTHPDIKVVLLTVYDDEHYLFQALRAGAKGYILKRIDAAELVGHLLRVDRARWRSMPHWPGASRSLRRASRRGSSGREPTWA